MKIKYIKTENFTIFTSLLAIENVQNHFIFKFLILISLFGEISPIKKKGGLRFQNPTMKFEL
jgi:hypothetical protein